MNPAAFRICGMCGTSLAGSTERRQERKVVTCLFCDLVGFTARAERMDPEDVRALLSPYHARVKAELERYGGTVEKFIGDAVMAVFGAPLAHEDDPERAVRAAIAILAYAREADLQLRIGIATGETLVALDARPEAGEAMVAGDVVNTAARLQAAAIVEPILVDEATHRTTRMIIDYGDPAEVLAKGKSMPVRAWPALGARSRFGSEADSGQLTPLVGRDTELAVLRGAFDSALDERTPRQVTLVGEPGIGKSRLVAELGRIVEDDPRLITWRKGRCLAYGDGISFWALGEIVKAQAGITEDEPRAETDRKVREMLEALIDEPGEATWVGTHLRPLVGLDVPLDHGADRRGEAFAAWRRLLDALARRGPTVIVVEDLHWADDGLLDWLDELLDWLDDIPLLVVGTARPELLVRRPAWSRPRPSAIALDLEPLSDESTMRLIAHATGRQPMADESHIALVERAGGNPLYAEQFARLINERSPIGALTVPESLHGIIAARVDALPGPEKATLQSASIVGKVFWSGSLGGDRWKTEDRLVTLGRRGFVVRQRRSSIDGETEWSFSHVLLRDVAYGEIPRGDRADRHRRTAEWIAGLGRPDDHAELIAHHWRAALSLARDSGRGDADELVEPTRLALRAAGRHAFALHAYGAAASYLAEAERLWPDDAPDGPMVTLELGRSMYVWADPSDPDLEATLSRAVLAARRAGDRDGEAEAEGYLSQTLWARGDRADEAERHLARGLELTTGSDSASATRVMTYAARQLALTGRPREAIPLARQARARAEAQGLVDLEAHALDTIGVARTLLGDPGGLEDSRRALDLAIASDPPRAASIANNLSVAYWYALDIERMADAQETGLALARRFGDGSGLKWLRGSRPETLMIVGRWDEALAAADEFVSECESSGSHYQESLARSVRGRIRSARGDPDGALADLRRGLELARATGDAQMLMPALGGLAREAHEHGHEAEGAARLEELIGLLPGSPREEAAFALAQEVLYAPVIVGHEGEVKRALGKPRGPIGAIVSACLDRDFRRAADVWAAAGSPTYEGLHRIRAAEELLAAGTTAAGRSELGRAMAFFRRVGASRYLEIGDRLRARAGLVEDR
jgi:class 3 adenylate cyclase/tetratricopeptide (TPR) repeat protein